MTTLSRLHTVPTVQRSSRTLGKGLYRVRGKWSAGGHQFDEDMNCTCGISWDSHQAVPSICVNQARYQHSNKKKKKNKAKVAGNLG